MSEPTLPGDLPLATVVAHANQIHKAFKGIMSCDEDALISVFKQLTSRHVAQVAHEYNKCHGKVLSTRVKNETKGKFGKLLETLLESNEALDSERLYTALKGMMVDEEVVMRVLAGRSIQEMNSIRSYYATTYGKELDKHIKDKFSGKEEQLMMGLLSGGRVEDGSRFSLDMDMSTLEQSIGQKNFTVGKIYTNLALLSMIETRSDNILRVFFDQFEKRYPSIKIETVLDKEGHKCVRILKPFIRSIRDPHGFRASLFELAMAGMGADEVQMNYVAARYRDPVYMGPLAESFQTLYGKSLEEKIRKEFSGDYEKLLVGIVECGKMQWSMIKVQQDLANKHNQEMLAQQMAAQHHINSQQQATQQAQQFAAQQAQQMAAQQMAAQQQAMAAQQAQQLAAQQLAAQQLAAQQLAAQQAQQMAAQQLAAQQFAAQQAQQQAAQQFAAQQLQAQQFAALNAVRDHVMSETNLHEHQQIAVPGGAFFVMQPDGNAVLYAKPGGPALWASGTGGRGPGPFRFAVQRNFSF